MKKFETLYALDKKGKIRSFEIGIDDLIGGTSVITSGTGLLGGKKVLKITHVSKGKGGRSIYEQAELVATSKWNEKLDEGYKNLKELQVSSFTNQFGEKRWKADIDRRSESLTEGYSEVILEEALKTAIGYWNTSKAWTPLPMLALPFKREKQIYPMIAQPKLDGVRCIAIPNPIRLCSRGGKFYIGLNHIEKELKIIFDKYPQLWLDGELYTHGVTQNEISGAARKQKRDLFTDYTWLEYHVYDVPSFQGNTSLSQVGREEIRKKFKDIFKELKYIKFIDSCYIDSDVAAKELHDIYVEKGYEGLILRDLSAPYMFSYRDKCLLKYKAFIIKEFVCKGYQCQTGDISTFTLIFTSEDGVGFGARCKGSHKLWKRYLDNPPIGRKMKIRYINRSAINNVPEKATVLPLADYDKWD